MTTAHEIVATTIERMLDNGRFTAELRQRISSLTDEIREIVERNGIYGEIACCTVAAALETDIAVAQAADKG